MHQSLKRMAAATAQAVHHPLSSPRAAPAGSLIMQITEQQQKAFLTAPKYAVIGASKDETKWGSKVRIYSLHM